MIDGCDLCSLQGDVDFHKMANSSAGGPEGHPMRFVYVKSSQYSRSRDWSYEKHVEKAKAAGLAVGAYHFCAQNRPVGDNPAVDSPEEQMGYFFKVSNGLGSRPGEMPPMIDWEHSAYTDEFNVEWLVRAVTEARKLWYPWYSKHQDRKVVVYSYPDFCRRHQQWLSKYPELSEMSDFCFASYKSVAPTPDNKWGLTPWYPTGNGDLPLHTLPKPWTEAKLVQYSGNRGMRVPGVSVDCDRMMFCGSQGDFSDFLAIERKPNILEFEIK